MYKTFFKGVFDFLLSLFLFLILSPIFVLVAFCLLFANSGKPFFLQKRPGLKGRKFWIVKFKTMNDRCDENGILLNDEKRLTAIGKFVRKTSLDEIPQLINVIKGDMSLIGPRPLLEEYLPLYDENQNRRHEVKPGITGWAQVNGRNAISWEQKFYFDVWYVDNLSLKLDMQIFWLTIVKVIRKEDINSKDNITMPKFGGRE